MGRNERPLTPSSRLHHQRPQSASVRVCGHPRWVDLFILWSDGHSNTHDKKRNRKTRERKQVKKKDKKKKPMGWWRTSPCQTQCPPSSTSFGVPVSFFLVGTHHRLSKAHPSKKNAKVRQEKGQRNANAKRADGNGPPPG